MIYVYKGLGLLCPFCTSYKMVSNPVDYANACNQPLLFLAPSQGKSNVLWLLAETPLRLEPLLIYGMQMHHLQSILRREKVIGRPCVLPWMICINYYSLCTIVEDFKACNSVTKVVSCLIILWGETCTAYVAST